jgi:hypothetical protein
MAFKTVRKNAAAVKGIVEAVGGAAKFVRGAA